MACESEGEVEGRDEGRSKGERKTAARAISSPRIAGHRKAAFLDHLASACNVKAAAIAAGISVTAVYKLRRRDEAFAAAWVDALIQGYVSLETQLVGHALAGDGAKIDTGSEAIGPIDRDLALKLLTVHGQRLRGKPSTGGPKPADGDRG